MLDATGKGVSMKDEAESVYIKNQPNGSLPIPSLIEMKPEPAHVESSLDFKNFALRTLRTDSLKKETVATFFHIPSGTECIMTLRDEDVIIKGGSGPVSNEDRAFLFFAARKLKFGW
jgi:hypothetical protein